MQVLDAPPDVERAQRRILLVLSVAQVAGGIGIGAAVSVGALLALDLTGSPAWSGAASTFTTLGAAAAAVPLARFAVARGRRPALASGWLVAAAGGALAVEAAMLRSFPLYLFALTLLGVGNAANLQGRFAATDLAVPGTRGRSLGLVVWSTTVGSVAGPNLTRPGAALAGRVGVPALSGPLLFSAAAALVAALVLVAALRPDPLLAARELGDAAGDERTGTAGDRSALAVIAESPRASAALASLVTGHAVMIAVMAMTPVHLHDHGASLTIIGLTISLHIAGMFALSPLVGWFADRYGRARGILTGQGILLLSALWTASAGASPARVTIGLVGIGLGWSFSTVSASTLFAEAVPVAERPRVQGVADLLMNFFGAAAGLSSGLLVALIGYGGLGLVAAAAVLPAATVVVARALPAPARAV